MTDADIIAAILKSEAGLVDDPADRGGITNYGITMPTLAAHRGGPVTADDIRHLGEQEARDIYAARYIKGPGFDQIESPHLRAVVVDCGVLHGPANAIKMLQRAVGADVDGKLGAQTLGMANMVDGKALGVKVQADRIKFLGRLITNDPTQSKFAAGWMNRVGDQIASLA